MTVRAATDLAMGIFMAALILLGEALGLSVGDE